MEKLTIGKLAKLGNVNIETVRFYERIELIPEPPRSRSGYRIFSPGTVNRIRFIKQAQELGFSLKEIKALLDLRVTTEATTSDVRMRATEKIADIGEKIKHLQDMKRSLEVLVEYCRGEASASECPILENLSSEDN